MKNNKSESTRQNLSNLTDIEREQKKYGSFVPDIPFSSTLIKNDQLELLSNYFFKQQSIYISKHNRFAAYPLHSHQFTELNYMLSGSCRQIINGEQVTLTQGNLLLIGIGASHEIKMLNEGDLLINILFHEKAVAVEWLHQMKNGQSPIIHYLLNLMVNRSDTSLYVLFQVNESQEIQEILKKMIRDYYSTKSYSSTISGLYLPILFTALAREFNQSYNRHAETPRNMAPVLQLIEENYKDISLAKAAERLGYNKTYLGNLIKKTVGVTFTQLVIKRRLYQARLLLNTTNLPISDIAHESGFSNLTYFYKAFKKMFGYLPSEEKKHLNES